MFRPDKVVVTRSKISARTNPDIVIIHQSNDYVCQLHEEETAEVLNEMDENYVEISAEQNIVLNHFDSFGLVQLKMVDVRKAPQNCLPPNVSPHFWQVLGYIDAHITETFIDSLEIKTHKLVKHHNIKSFLKLPRNQKLHTMIRDAYIESFQNLDIVPTNKFGQNVNFTEMAVISRNAFKPKVLITGLRGCTAKIDERDLLDDMTFSVFAPTTNCKHSRIRLGPASFVNHDCNPNSRYKAEGKKNLTVIGIETITSIAPGEEITVSYGDDYFGKRNEQCLCSTCCQSVEGECDEVDAEPVVENIIVDAEPVVENNIVDAEPVVENIIVDAEPVVDNIIVDAEPVVDNIIVDADPGVENIIVHDDGEHELQLDGELQSDGEQVDGVDGECDEADTEPIVGTAESEYNRDIQTASKSGKRVKEVKMDAMVDCLICFTHVKRIKRHLAIHQNIDDADVQLLVDFYRTRNAKRAFDCHDCKRRFVSVVTHKYKSNCACNSVMKVDNCSSRR